MSLKIIVVGDATDHGGKVISGSPLHDVDGKPVARFGDQVDYPQHSSLEKAMVSLAPKRSGVDSTKSRQLLRHCVRYGEGRTDDLCIKVWP